MTPFGRTLTGLPVHALTLSAGDLTVRILTLGAALQSVRLASVSHDLTLGSERVADYEGAMKFHGTLVGPVANRISGATATLDGRELTFEAEDEGFTLHAGSAGTHAKVWDVIEEGADFAVLGLTLPDGEGGFPGTRQVRARYDVSAPARLRLTITVTTDAPTLVNFTNHSYWTLDGGSDYAGHVLKIDADRVLPTDDDALVTGEIVPVESTDLDFRIPRRVAPGDPWLDHNFCLSDGPTEEVRDVLWLSGVSGVTMTVGTNRPGIQVYDGRNALRPQGKPHEGLAIEAQDWPDAPSHDAFPSIRLDPEETYESVTEWRFT